MDFPLFVSFTLERLEKNSFSAYLVGGCVRDSLMGIVPHDYDVTTNALPEDILHVFSDIKTLDIGKKHGTITLVFDGGETVEVTTYRIDGTYTDSRHPECVSFTDKVELDLARRDFTVNAIAFSPSRGFVDVFSGRDDIGKKKIVCVGNPRERFDEDALRILRALRFSSKLGFFIEEKTKTAILEKRELLLNIATERINAEFCSLIDGKGASAVICEYIDVIRVFLPELEKIDEKSLEMAQNESLIVKLCVVFYELHCDLIPVLKRLKFDSKTINNICNIIGVYREYGKYEPCRISVKKIVSRLGEDLARSYFAFLRCVGCVCETYPSKHEVIFSNIISEGCCLTLRQLCIDGNDLLENVDVEQKKIGKILQTLLNDVIEEKILNEKSCLIGRAIELAKKL